MFKVPLHDVASSAQALLDAANALRLFVAHFA